MGSRCVHIPPTERPFSSSSHPSKATPRGQEEAEAAFAMICGWLLTPQTAHPMRPQHCSRERCRPSFDGHQGHTVIPFLHVAGPPSFNLIFHFTLGSAFLSLLSWRPDDGLCQFSFDACSNLCFFHGQHCLFPLGTVNVMWLCIVMENCKFQNNISNYFSKQSCCSGICPVTIHIQT